MVKVLNKVIKDLVAPGKYKCGLKEVLPSIKASKLLILSNSVPLPAEIGNRRKIEGIHGSNLLL